MSEKLKAHEADDGQIDLEFTEEAQDVILEDNNESESTAEAPVVETSADEDDHEKYSNSVQKRINQLTKRAKEAEREREEALRYAQNIQAENTDVKQRLQTLDRSYIDEYGHRVSSEQARAKDELKSAIEMGDTDRQMQAQERITQLTLAADKHAQAKASREAQAQQAQQQQEYAQQQQAQQEYAVDYQNMLAQEKAPFEVLGAGANILQQLSPQTVGQQTTAPMATTNPFAQAAGIIGTGVGLRNLMG